MLGHSSEHTFKQRNLITSGWTEYKLLDSGNRKKLEQFNHMRIIRFEPEAEWKPSLLSSTWKQANAQYLVHGKKDSGGWDISKKTPRKWQITIDNISAELSIDHSPHIGIFPEQVENWRWLAKNISETDKPIRVLNLFAYTGLSTLFSAEAGAKVTHVDASRKAIRMAKHNALLSSINEDRIRWIVDDAQKFVERELRRKNQYEGIILDPPLFGKGPKGEIWKFDKSLSPLLDTCKKLFSTDPKFLLLTAYNISESPHQLAKFISRKLAGLSGKIEYGFLRQKDITEGKLINQSIYVRWSKGHFS